MRDEHIDADARLADLVASRLCHDLVNPLGAIGNGVELLEMTGKADGPEVDLIRDAVRAAEARIRLFRLAFGGAAPGQVTSAREARAAAEGYFNQSRVDLTWMNEADAPRAAVKNAFLMLLCAETALPLGGTIRISVGENWNWQLEATGSRLNIDEDIWSLLRFGTPGEGRALRPADAQFPVLQFVCEKTERSVNYVVEDDTLRMSLS
ncbi:histidine phosphotransferase family protein [Gymnodinialimonas sp. 2305UL16-5]|uniref:histidine phosphotransferase family protein n=1 Tax=Gymnodinialimonas mytili TaxID=3126503 RepID=UPI0030A6DC15